MGQFVYFSTTKRTISTITLLDYNSLFV